MGGLQVENGYIQEALTTSCMLRILEEIMKEILIFLGGVMFGGFVGMIVFCLITVGKFKNTERKNIGE